MYAYIVVGCFILFDVLTGVLKGLHEKALNSTILREGLFHKLSEVLACVGAGGLQYAVKYIDLGVNIPVFSVVCAYICVTELVSVIENLCVLNPKLNELFSGYLEKLKKN